MKSVIEIRNLTMKFGELMANEDVSFDIENNGIVSLIGPNGAGKTTLFNCVTGFYKPFSGKVTYWDEAGVEQDITGRPTHEICRKGITRNFQIVKTLSEMTVEQNIMTGAFLHTNKTSEARDLAEGVLRRTGLLARKDILGRNLTIAERKRVEIARALATEPRVLMLDECMAGLNQTEIKDVMNLILDLKAQGLTLLVVEHIMEAIMPISDKIVVLDSGKKIAEGPPQEIANNDEVIKAYLGEKYHAKSKKS
ncbi:MAG TPA: ABC transporter ATP-binding protein [Clostridiales bacterium]|nr:ABC transporter ATP-binding protein [Clostridiales bacterium]